MTTWSMPQIGRWASDAGFTGDDVVHAVALAMAATGGQDHYRQNPGSFPETERRGLYAIAVKHITVEAPADLFDPVSASAILRRIVCDLGDRWDWHPVHLSGEALRFAPIVRMALSDKRSYKGAVPADSFAQRLENMAGLRRAVEQAGRMSHTPTL